MMRKMHQKVTATALGTLLLSSMAITPALAAPMEYQFDGANQWLFGTPTTVETVTVAGEEPVNMDRSKNVALIPPAFGSPTSNLPGSGEYLTPNLVTNQIAPEIISYSGTMVVPPSQLAVEQTNQIVYPSINNEPYYWTNYYAYTTLTSDLYYSNGSIATLSIPAINLVVKAYEGTSNASMAKGVGHFSDTSIWDGNVAFAGHNRGTANYFGKIHLLEYGDKITLTTKLGARTYKVYSVSKIGVNDTSVLQSSYTNMLTLITCVANQPDYRYCVLAKEV